jgi:hypothetical protein
MASRPPPAPLSPLELAHLQERGWLVLAGVVPAGTVRELNGTWDRLCAGVPLDEQSNAGPPGLGEEPAFRSWLEEPRVVAAVAALIGPDHQLREICGRAPPPGRGRQGLHADWHTPVPVDRQLFANAFLLLDPMDAGNGATRVVPGSHRWYQVPRGPVAQPLAHHPGEQTVEGQAGDVFVFSAHLWHSGAENRSGRRRRVVMGRYVRAGTPLVPSSDG